MYLNSASGTRKSNVLYSSLGLIFCLALTSYGQEAPPAVRGATFTVLDNLTGTNGAYAYTSPVEGLDGNLYGTTTFGGTHAGGNFYQLTRVGTLTSLYSFCSQPSCTDGSFLAEGGTLALNTDGSFYGTTGSGGASAVNGPCAPYGGCGTIFQITPGGTLNTLYNFCSQSNCVDGDISYSGVVRGTDGNFYGTTPGQGANVGPNCTGGFFGVGCGTVFQITRQGAFTTIYSFCALANCADGYSPFTGLTAGADGSLYGITSGGGATGQGTIFKLTPGGSLTTLHSFNGTDGFCGFICASMIQAADGSFYGVTNGGGTNNAGTDFKVSSSGNFKTLYDFCSQPACADGGSPNILAQGTDGNFYGTTSSGADGGGTLFELTSRGKLVVLHVFEGIGGLPGGYPGGQYAFGLTQATNGSFYGTTSGGGPAGAGVLFSLVTGLGPFVTTLPVTGQVGAKVDILGTNLTGATGVGFNNTPALFQVVSDSLISATVPAGATTGWVTVTTTGGTLQSNVRFRVRP